MKKPNKQRLTTSQLREALEKNETLRRLNPHIYGTTDNQGVCAPKQKQAKRKTLEHPVSREGEGRSRFKICFTIFARRPLDYDNYWTKCFQDLLVQAGILHDDKWDVLQGEIISQKAHIKEDERLELQVFKL